MGFKGFRSAWAPHGHRMERSDVAAMGFKVGLTKQAFGSKRKTRLKIEKQ